MHTKTFHMYITRLHKNGRGIFYFGYELSTFIQYKRTAFYCMLNERWWMRWWQSDWLIVCRLNCSVQSGWSIFPLQKLLPTIKGICGHSIKWNCLEFHSSNWFLFANGPKYVYHCYHQQIASDESLSSKMEIWLMEKRHTSGMHSFIEINWKYGILPEFKYGISTGWIHTYFAVGHFFCKIDRKKNCGDQVVQKHMTKLSNLIEFFEISLKFALGSGKISISNLWEIEANPRSQVFVN